MVDLADILCYQCRVALNNPDFAALFAKRWVIVTTAAKRW